jgi:hypothetical protein
LTRFTFGAIHPLNVGDLTLAEITEYVRAMDKHAAEQPVTPRR